MKIACLPGALTQPRTVLPRCSDCRYTDELCADSPVLWQRPHGLCSWVTLTGSKPWSITEQYENSASRSKPDRVNICVLLLPRPPAGTRGTTVSILQNAHLIHPFIFYSSILTPVSHCRHHGMWWAHCMTQLSNKHPIMLCGKFKLMSRPSWFWFQLSVVCCDDPVLMFWLRLGTVTTWVELRKIMCWL